MEIYPETVPFDLGYLDVGYGHKLYYERQGNRKGKPVIYLHGGPGAGCSFQEYRMFDPQHFNVLMFDQRGCGESTPYGSTQANDTRFLINDIETLRLACEVEKWSVCGGSWGSALAMTYAAECPQHIERLLLRGVFFADAEGADHINHARALRDPFSNPYFKEYHDFIPADELQKDGLLKAYHKRVMSDDEALAIEAARRFYVMDTTLATYKHDQDAIDAANKEPRSTLALSRLWFHYAMEEFRDENKATLLNAMRKFNGPVDIIHGLNDQICPVENARLLAMTCKHATLTTPAQCGHAQSEPALKEAFMNITERWKREDQRLRKNNTPKLAP